MPAPFVKTKTVAAQGVRQVDVGAGRREPVGVAQQPREQLDPVRRQHEHEDGDRHGDDVAVALAQAASTCSDTQPTTTSQNNWTLLGTPEVTFRLSKNRGR